MFAFPRYSLVCVPFCYALLVYFGNVFLCSSRTLRDTPRKPPGFFFWLPAIPKRQNFSFKGPWELRQRLFFFSVLGTPGTVSFLSCTQTRFSRPRTRTRPSHCNTTPTNTQGHPRYTGVRTREGRGRPDNTSPRTTRLQTTRTQHNTNRP